MAQERTADLSTSTVPLIDAQTESSCGIEHENNEILQTGYTALPLVGEDGECSDSENSCTVDEPSIEDGGEIKCTEDCTVTDQNSVCLSAQDVQQIRNAMQRYGN